MLRLKTTPAQASESIVRSKDLHWHLSGSRACAELAVLCALAFLPQHGHHQATATVAATALVTSCSADVLHA
jgi:hypothetical protein